MGLWDEHVICDKAEVTVLERKGEAVSSMDFVIVVVPISIASARERWEIYPQSGKYIAYIG